MVKKPEVVHDPNALPILEDPQSKAGVVEWLNSLKPNFESNHQETCLHVANELMDKLFKGSETDALKPYATAKEKGKKEPKYPSLIMSYSKAVEGKKTKKTIVYPEWEKANTNFTDAKDGKWYIATLVHLGGILKWKDAPEGLSFNHQWTLAKTITKKLVRIPDPNKKKEEGAVYLDKFATKIAPLKVEELDKALADREQEAKDAKEKSRTKTQEAKEAKATQVTVVVPAGGLDKKELKALVNRVKDAENKFRRIYRETEEVWRDIITDIQVALKGMK